jgi:hypothetical protein
MALAATSTVATVCSTANSAALAPLSRSTSSSARVLPHVRQLSSYNTRRDSSTAASMRRTARQEHRRKSNKCNEQSELAQLPFTSSKLTRVNSCHLLVLLDEIRM